jgi:hypothetical protein
MNKVSFFILPLSLHISSLSLSLFGVLSRIVYTQQGRRRRKKGKIGIGRRQSEVHTLTVSRNKLKAKAPSSITKREQKFSFPSLPVFSAFFTF